MSSKLVILVVIAAMLTSGLLYKSLSSHSTDKVFSRKLMETFARWKQVHGRLYASPAENDFRLSVFAKELEFVERKNQEYEAKMAARGEKLSGPMFEMNKLGDLTEEEFLTSYTGLAPMDSEFIQQPLNEEDVLQTSTQNSAPNLGQTRFSPRVRHQGSCGSCWAFSAVIELERKIWAHNGQYVDLSQQEMVDCVTGSNGCQGGHPEYAYNYVRQFGLRTAAQYPYVSAKLACRNNMGGGWTFNDLAQNTGFLGFSRSRSQTASDRLVMPPVMVFSTGAFKYLSRTDDVYDASMSGECHQTINHAITQWGSWNGIVTVVNSWGTEWAYGGYKRIKPCNDNNLWGNGGRLVIPYGY